MDSVAQGAPIIYLRIKATGKVLSAMSSRSASGCSSASRRWISLCLCSTSHTSATCDNCNIFGEWNMRENYYKLGVTEGGKREGSATSLRAHRQDNPDPSQRSGSNLSPNGNTRQYEAGLQTRVCGRQWRLGTICTRHWRGNYVIRDVSMYRWCAARYTRKLRTLLPTRMNNDLSLPTKRWRGGTHQHT